MKQNKKNKSEEFIQNVKDFRLKNDLSLSGFARKVGISKAYLHQLENRRSKRVSLEIAIKLANACYLNLNKYQMKQNKKNKKEAYQKGRYALACEIREISYDTCGVPTKSNEPNVLLGRIVRQLKNIIDKFENKKSKKHSKLTTVMVQDEETGKGEIKDI